MIPVHLIQHKPDFWSNMLDCISLTTTLLKGQQPILFIPSKHTLQQVINYATLPSLCNNQWKEKTV